MPHCTCTGRSICSPGRYIETSVFPTKFECFVFKSPPLETPPKITIDFQYSLAYSDWSLSFAWIVPDQPPTRAVVRLRLLSAGLIVNESHVLRLVGLFAIVQRLWPGCSSNVRCFPSARYICVLAWRMAAVRYEPVLSGRGFNVTIKRSGGSVKRCLSEGEQRGLKASPGFVQTNL